jgi:hypothetical protein
MIILKGAFLGIVLLVGILSIYWFGLSRVPFGTSATFPVDLLRKVGTFLAACGLTIFLGGIGALWVWKVAAASLLRHGA